MFPELPAALSEGQRAIAHLVVLLVLAAAAGLLYLIRRKVRHADKTSETPRRPEDA